MTAGHEDIHPDEGTIHAWLDDALDASEASRLESHVATCASCASRVAEARGLIAGASRVVGLLDDAPGPLLKSVALPTTVRDFSLWRALRVTPARAALAATLLVAIGLTLTRDKVSMESSRVPADSASMVMSSPADVSAPMAGAASDAGAAQSQARPDSVLASAITRRLRIEQPQRVMDAAPGVTVPAAPPSVATAPVMNTDAASKVARGLDSTRLAAVAVSGSSADKVQFSARETASPAGAGCYRIESRDASGSWLGIPMPVEIALAPSSAFIESTDGAPSFAITAITGGAPIGSWTRIGSDTIAMAFRGLSATTRGRLVSDGSTLAGTLRASSVGGSEERVAAGAPTRSDARAMRQAPAAGAAADVIRVIARRISCPR